MLRGVAKPARCVGWLVACAALAPSVLRAAVPEQREWIGAKSGGVPPTATPPVWDLPANWQNNTPPSTKNDLAHFGGMSGTAFIRMPDDLTFGALRRDGSDSSAAAFYLVGKNLVVDGSAWTTAAGTAKIAGGRLIGYYNNGSGSFEVRVYANVTNYRDMSGRFDIAGDLVAPQITASVGTLQWRGDWYANGPDEMRTNAFDIAYLNNSSGQMTFTSAGGTAARDSTGWYQITGSAYLSYVGSSIGTIAPGCRVSGDGIPAGTYLRRYFPNLMLIELSAPVTETLASNTLHFDAYVPVTTGRIPKLNANNDSVGLSFDARRSNGLSSFTIEIDEMSSNEKTYTAKTPMTLAISCGTYPAKLILGRTDRVRSSVVFQYASDLVFLEPSAGLPGFVNSRFVEFKDTARHRATVVEGLTAFYTNVTAMAAGGTLTKAGPGTLVLSTTNTLGTVGTALVAEGGTLALYPRASSVTVASVSVSSNATFRLVCTGTGAVTSLKVEGTNAVAELRCARATVTNLTGSAGGTVRFQGESLVPAKLSCEPGVTIQADAGATVDLSKFTALPAGLRLEGPGTFIVRELDVLKGVVPGPDAVIRILKEGSERGFREIGEVAPEVVGNPAFWVDASKNVTIFSTNGVNPVSGKSFNYTDCVSCWQDCRVRAGSDAYRDIYATNDCTQIPRPHGYASSRRVTAGGKSCIRHMGDVVFATDATGTGNERYVMAGMVWNRPITNVWAVFTAVYQNNGNGQAVLGRTRRFPTELGSTGFGDFCRGLGSDYGDPAGVASPTKVGILSAKASDNVTNGWVYAGGKAIAWNTPVYSSGTFEILEMHPKGTPGKADAFAVQDLPGLSQEQRVTCSGCNYQCETIVYTNQLTQAEREKVCAYLLRKYLGQVYLNGSRQSRYEDDGYAAELPVAEGISLALDVDDTLFADRLSGEGTLVKKGTGSIYADLVSGTSLRVEGGTMIVHSAKPPEGYDDLPPQDAYVHWDAANTNSMFFVKRNDTFGDGHQPPSRSVTEVQKWYHTRHGNDGFHPYGTSRKSDGRYRAGWIVEDGLNGLPVVDYGPLVSWKDPMAFQRRVFHELHLTDANVAVRATPIRSIFQVKDTSGGGNWVMGDTTSGNGISRGTTTTNYAAAIVNSIGTVGTVGAILNGAAIDPSKVGYTGGWDQLALHCQSGLYKGDQYGCNAAFTIAGGVRLAEMMIFTNTLTWTSSRTIDAYLGGKWLNRTLPYASASTAGVVVVSSGALLVVEGGEPLRAKTLSGGGMVDGSVVMTGGGILEVYVNEDGSPVLPPTAVTGSVDVSAGGTVRVTGYVDRARAGVYPIVTASSVKSGLWRCVAEGAKRSIKVRFNARAMNLVVTGCGGAIIVR